MARRAGIARKSKAVYRILLGDPDAREVAEEQRNLVSRFVEREVSRIQNVDFCSRHGIIEVPAD